MPVASTKINICSCRRRLSQSAVCHFPGDASFSSCVTCSPCLRHNKPAASNPLSPFTCCLPACCSLTSMGSQQPSATEKRFCLASCIKKKKKKQAAILKGVIVVSAARPAELQEGLDVQAGRRRRGKTQHSEAVVYCNLIQQLLRQPKCISCDTIKKNKS